eukprot:gene24439-10039_t
MSLVAKDDLAVPAGQGGSLNTGTKDDLAGCLQLPRMTWQCQPDRGAV